MELLQETESQLHVKSSAQSYFLQHEDPSFTGVLAIHGFLSSPLETRPVANYLYDSGHYDVLGIRLSGHGTSPEDLSEATIQRWLADVQSAYDFLCNHYQQVAIYGISMGALLSLHLAMKRPPVALVCLGSMLRSMNWKLRWGSGVDSLFSGAMNWYCNGKYQPNDSYFYRKEFVYDRIPYSAALQLTRLSRETKRRLVEVSCPLLVIHSQDDRVADPVSAELLYAGVKSDDKHLLWGQGPHVFLDHEDDDTREYFSKISRFFDAPLTFELDLSTDE